MQNTQNNPFFTLDKVSGEIEAVGKAKVLAAAWNNGEPVILWLSGSTTAVKSIRAQFNGCKVRIEMKRGKSYYRRVRLKASRPMQVIHTRDESIAEDHMLLLSDLLVKPQAADRTAYALSYQHIAHPTMDERSILLLGQRIKNAVTIPVLREWYKPLIDFGWDEKRIQAIDSEGCRVWGIQMDQAFWEESISDLLRKGDLEFPRQRNW